MIARREHSGFTLVELMVGMALALMVMSAVLSSYIYLGRSLTRLVNQQTLETQSRRALLSFAQDVRMASSLSSPSATGVTFTLPTSSSTTTVAYSYDSSGGTLTRTPASGTAQVLLTNLRSFSFSYYNASGTAVTTYNVVSTPSIRQVALTFSSQAGTNSNGTQTAVYQAASARESLHNKAWSP